MMRLVQESRECCDPAAIPLHRRAYAIPVPEINIVPHADFVSVIDDGCARHGHQHSVQKLNSPPVIVHHWRQSAPDSEIQSHALVFCVLVVHVVPLDVSHHLQCQLIMVAKEQTPLATVGNLRSLLEYFDDRLAVLEL